MNLFTSICKFLSGYYGLLYLIRFFSRFFTFFSRFSVRSLEYFYVFFDPSIHFRSEVRSYPKTDSTVVLKSEFRRRRTAGRPRNCARHFDTKFSRNQNIDRDRRGLGTAVLSRAGEPKWTIFSRES